MSHAATVKAERGSKVSICIGCMGVINDQYKLRVAPDMEWHAACLKCVDCNQFLDEYCSCFVRNGKTYCKRDYERLFGAKCDKCERMFEKTDLVMRARTKIYHLDCFRCTGCAKQLLPGEEFALNEDGLYCQDDFDQLQKKANVENNNTININKNDIKTECVESKPIIRKERREGKTTRIRTVMNEKQLHTLRTCYTANCRPDALMKEQLVEMTGLSPRVIRVWFQNKRCKDKKRAILFKYMQNEKDKQQALQGITGVPMVASSPIRHDGGPMGPVGHNGYMTGSPHDVTAYQPPWKALTEFSLTHDLDRLDPTTPEYQHLLQQMHGYGAEMCPVPDFPGPGFPPSHHQQGPPQHTPPHLGGPTHHHQQVESKYSPGSFDDSVHSDSYFSYFESDDSMTPLSSTTSPI
ncbi:unnamed protein product, partial [Meganyctiphanes norvegica]